MLDNNKLVFNKDEHRYEYNGVTLISVTQLLQKHGLSPDYSQVPQKVLSMAADRGTLIHKEIEDYNKNHEIGFTKELDQFCAYISEHPSLKVVKSEFKLFNDVVAGCADLLLQDDKDLIIADIKTTSNLHIDSVSWQLSVYAYLSELNITKGQAFHFQKDGTLKVVDIELKPKETIARLFDCERQHIIFNPNANLDAALVQQLVTVEEVIKKYEEEKKKAEEQATSLRESIKSAMESTGLISFENERIKLTYVPATKKVIVDSAKLKTKYPDVAADCQKESQVKASLRITLKEASK